MAADGIALAAIVFWGYRMWPGIALGALLANSWTGIPLYSTLGITIGNTGEALVGASPARSPISALPWSGSGTSSHWPSSPAS